MPIVFDCQCGKRYRAKDDRAGRPFDCPGCGKRCIVPGDPELDLGIVTEVSLKGVIGPDRSPRFEYRCVQVPPTIGVREGTPMSRKASDYLEEVINSHAKKGWEFFRVDPIGIWVNPGCFRALLGAQPTLVQYYVITFRRDAG